MSWIRLVITGPALISFLHSGKKYSSSFLSAQIPDSPTTFPILFSWIISFVFNTIGLNRLWWPTKTEQLFCRAIFSICSASDDVAEIGFSIRISNPKFSADIAFSWCIIVGVEIITPSTLVDFFNSLRSSNIDILL